MSDFNMSEKKYNALMHAIIFQIEQINNAINTNGITIDLQQSLDKANNLHNYFSSKPNGFSLEQAQTAYIYAFLYNEFCKHNNDFTQDIQPITEFINDLEFKFSQNGICISDFFNVNKSKVGRNSPCPCGSGKKYKHCCGK